MVGFTEIGESGMFFLSASDLAFYLRFSGLDGLPRLSLPYLNPQFVARTHLNAYCVQTV
jgi:hypothetical protein